MPWVRTDSGVRYEAPPELSVEQLKEQFNAEIAMHLATDYARDPDDHNKLIDKNYPDRFITLEPEKFTFIYSLKLNEFLDSFEQKQGSGEN